MLLAVACRLCQPKGASFSLFKKVWNEFEDIVQEKASGHAKCEVCGDHESRYDALDGRVDSEGRRLMKELEAEKAEHAAYHLGEREYAEDWWENGRTMPGKFTAFSMDAPTEKQFDLPVQQRTARDPIKGLDTAKKWSSKITGLLMAGIGMLTFVTRDGLGSGADLSCTVLYLGMLAMAQHGRRLAPRFHCLLDNTGADNKNNTVLYFLAWLVMMDYVTEASIFCMVKGHTYSRIDQTFRTLIRRLLSLQVDTVRAMLDAILAYLRPYNPLGVHELHALWNWTDYFAPHIHHKFGGFGTGQYGSGMHEFVCRKDKDGDVRLLYRPSAAASTWLPQGEGLLVFKSIPQGQPPLKEAHKDSAWKRDVVENTIHRWFSLMQGNAARLAIAKSEWDAKFEALPVDGDTSALPDHMKPQWAELPKNAVEAAATADYTTRAAADFVEIPPVDPVTGGARTAAQVQAEKEYYQRCVRARQGSDKAVFQGDFLFLKGAKRGESPPTPPPTHTLACAHACCRPAAAPCCCRAAERALACLCALDDPVALHRVAHGMCLVDATCEDISFTTAEYEQFEWDEAGFFGHFRPKVNPAYDAKDKKSGAQFVRRRGVTREDVLVYDVNVFETAPEKDAEDPRKRLRVALDSLRALSLVCTAQPAISDVTIPGTHAADGGESGGADVLLFPLKNNVVRVLRAELRKRGLPTTGGKSDLVDRLEQAVTRAVTITKSPEGVARMHVRSNTRQHTQARTHYILHTHIHTYMHTHIR